MTYAVGAFKAELSFFWSFLILNSAILLRSPVLMLSAFIKNICFFLFSIFRKKEPANVSVPRSATAKRQQRACCASLAAIP